MDTTKQQRIEIVNKIIRSISMRSRCFFSHKGIVAYIFEKNGRLYMKNEYSGAEMFLHTKFGYPAKGFHHGGTLWGLTKDFKEFIINGGHPNGLNGYGGLFCTNWGYPENNMKEIQDYAKELGYLKQ